VVASEETQGDAAKGEEGFDNTSSLQDALDGNVLPKTILKDAYDAMQLFHDKLVKEGELRGLIGPRDTTILWERHILNSAAVVPFVTEALQHQQVTTGVADLGSGGGFPGIVIASCLRDVPVTLIEPMERRIQWLSEVVDLLELDNVSLLRARAEELVPASIAHPGTPTEQQAVRFGNAEHEHRGASQPPAEYSQRFNVVSCRAVAPMRKLAPLALPLLVPGGQLVALKGRSAPQELAKALPMIKKAKGFRSRVLEAPVGEGLESTHVVIVEKR
jgi:16S rRNA (guanine527-N7)-methyltransferase